MQREWQCCLCCHVRTGTIFLGIWHLILHVIAISIISVVIVHPEILEYNQRTAINQLHNRVVGSFFESVNTEPILPTPLSDNTEVINDGLQDANFTENSETGMMSLGGMWRKSRLSHHDINVALAVTLFTCVITLLLVYGAIKRRASYLLPFFCLQVFDYCIACLTLIGYLTCPPNVPLIVMENPNLPGRNDLLHMNPQGMFFIVLVIFVVTLIVKAYFIRVVWSCYKYLTLRARSAAGVIQVIDPDSQNLLSEHKMEANGYKHSMFPPPPPSYEAAMAAASYNPK